MSSTRSGPTPVGGFPQPNEDGRYDLVDLMAYMTAVKAERYAALRAAYGDDVDAMLTFPWTPPVRKER